MFNVGSFVTTIWHLWHHILRWRWTFFGKKNSATLVNSFGMLHKIQSVSLAQGTKDSWHGWRSLFSFRSILLVLTHDFIIILIYGPTGGGGHEWLKDAALLYVLYAWGHV